MNKVLATILLAVIAIPSTLAAGMPFEFELSPVAMFNSGTTDYTIEFPDHYDVTPEGDSVLVYGRSQLEFPLDATLAGIDLEARARTGAGKDLTFNVSAIMNVIDPSTKMEDHDWWFDPNGTESIKWCYTESRTKMNYLLLKFEAAMSIVQKPKVQLALMAGFHYNKMEFDVMGYDGWKVGSDGLAHDLPPVDPDVRSLYYKATYKIPQVGFRINLKPSTLGFLGMQIAVGRLMASDLDDHLLRGKTAEASTTGWAFLTRARGRLLLTQHGSARPFLSVQFEYSKHSASGSQTQTWYQDEVYPPDPETGEEQIVRAGTSISGISYETNAHQLRFGFGFGLAF